MTRQPVKPTFPRQAALPVAERLVSQLRPACEDIRICGSLRRERQDIHDIEIVARSKRVPDPDALVGLAGDVDALPIHIERLGLEFDAELPRNGDRYKRLRVERIPVDLFLVPDASVWGMAVAVRTGPAEFSRLLVAERRKGGALPDGWKVADGWKLFDAAGNRRGTFTELDVFEALGLPWIPPPRRTERKLKDLLTMQEA